MILGVDPGKHGALAVISGKELVKVWDMPLTPDGSSIDPYALGLSVDFFAKEIRFAVVEDVSAMTYVNARGEKRGQGAAASFAFGKYTGMIHGIIASYSIPMFLVRPSVWKMTMGLSSAKGDSLALASDAFPKAKGEWKLKKHDGRAEAALLALFGHLKFSKRF